jgi:putative nucleotidyltransferase with HDIG domain/MYXO-CTERM domain-containing protein
MTPMLSRLIGRGTVPASPSGEGLVPEDLVKNARDRNSRPLQGRERIGEGIAAAAFVLVAVPMAFLLGSERAFDPTTAAVLVAAFVVASRIKFETGAGYTNPTQLVFVPMLFLLPTETVPLFVAAANLIGEFPDYARGKRHPERVLVTLSDSWYAIAPALILVGAGAEAPLLADWPIFVAALGAQFAADLGVNAVREWFEYGVEPRTQLAEAGWYLAVDGLLAPIGFVCAVGGPGDSAVLILLLPLFALLWIFARQRRHGLESALELSDAYRGTTLLLADVIEHDDHYTGSHSKGVVTLSLEVAHKMGLDAHGMRNVEFAALLHDVGKLAISKEIINKEGPLSSEEWALMRLHTITGEQMLHRIGGLFDEVAKLVRSSHERWDGTGYPDGLAGVAIPLESRIVSCCDAFDAMTTDRSYRPAMTTVEALAELRANAGTQFDPGVAWTLIELVEASEKRRYDPMLNESARFLPAAPEPEPLPQPS